MAKWVSQAIVPSITPAARKRTAYLRPLLPTIVAAIKEYFQAQPEGEEVTLAVAEALGHDVLKRSARDAGYAVDRVKKDVGLLIAQTLPDLHGASRVETLRKEDGRSVSLRRNRRPQLRWITSFTPHRLKPEATNLERILLDSSVVRGVVHDDPQALDLSELARLKGAHPISVADGALAELAAALLRDSIPWAKWAKQIGDFDAVLDPEFPVAPGGRELAAFWGAQPPTGMNLDEVRAYYRAAWAYLRNARSAADLARREVFYGPSGRTYAIRLDASTVETAIRSIGEKWSRWVTSIAGLIHEERGEGKKIDEASLRRAAESNLLLDMAAADVEKLDLVIHVLARRAFEAARPVAPYSPRGEPNDALDLDLMFGIPLPGWVCTADRRLHRVVQATASTDRSAVMTPTELLDRLSALDGTGRGA